MRKSKFPQDVARFLHPEKSVSTKSPSGIHRREKAHESSYIPVYSAADGPAHSYINQYGQKAYR